MMAQGPPAVPGALPTGKVSGGALKWDPQGQKYFREPGKPRFIHILKHSI